MGKLEEFSGLRRDQMMARALDRVICGTASTGGMGPAEVAVLIDSQTLAAGRHDDTVCEYSDGTSIPVEAARRHACEAKIIPVVLGGDSQPLDVGRARRLATPTQRIALRAMYRTCAIDGCDQHFDACHIHHLMDVTRPRAHRPRQPGAVAQFPPPPSARGPMATATRSEHPPTHRETPRREHALPGPARPARPTSSRPGCLSHPPLQRATPPLEPWSGDWFCPSSRLRGTPSLR